MRITVDRGTCEGLGMCESMAHEFFEVDDDDTLIIHNENPAEEDRKLVLAAVNSCPVLALKLEG
jgi:ferredoxin